MDLDGTRVLLDGFSRIIRIQDGQQLQLVNPKGEPLKGVFGRNKSSYQNRICLAQYMPFGVDRIKQEIFVDTPYNFPQIDYKPSKKNGGLVGFSLKLKGDTVTVTPTGLQMKAKQAIPLGDKLYLPKQIVDRQTGAVTKGGPTALHIFQLAAGHTYGVNKQFIKDKKNSKPTGNQIRIFDLSGKQTASMVLPWIDPAKDPHVKKAYDQGIITPNYAGPMNFGRDCIYIRDNAYLYCIQ